MNDTNVNEHLQSPEHDPSAQALLNEAIEWLQCARGVTATLADLVHEADSVDCKQMSLSLDAIASMTQAGLQRIGQAHAAWCHNELRSL